MKPAEIREMRQRQEAERVARGRALEEFLLTDAPRDKVVPELIPDSIALAFADREARKLIRLIERTPRGGRRVRLMDELLLEVMPRLVFVQRVMAKDELERAALTPADLVMLSRVDWDAVKAEYRRMDPHQSEVAS